MRAFILSIHPVDMESEYRLFDMIRTLPAYYWDERHFYAFSMLVRGPAEDPTASAVSLPYDNSRNVDVTRSTRRQS
jgi:hypothetical protein